MKSGRPEQLKIIVMPRAGASAHTITVSRRAAGGAFVCMLLLIGLNTASLLGFSRNRAADSDLRALEARTRELSDRMAALTEAERSLDSRIRSYFAEQYFDEPENGNNTSLNITGDSVRGAGYGIDKLDDSIQARAAQFENAEERISEAFREIARVPELMPVRGGHVFSGYGTRTNPATGKQDFHYGVDIEAGIGAPVYAAGAGAVKSVRFDSGYGLTVILDHGNGFVTQYAHLHAADVKPGQTVRKGERIASLGDSGMADRPHLCFEALLNGRQINPEKLLALTPEDIARSGAAHSSRAATQSF